MTRSRRLQQIEVQVKMGGRALPIFEGNNLTKVDVEWLITQMHMLQAQVTMLQVQNEQLRTGFKELLEFGLLELEQKQIVRKALEEE